MGPQLDEARLTAFGVAGVFRGGATRAPSVGLHLWLDRRTTPGPEITTKGLDTLFGVPWPPGDRERDRAVLVLRGIT
jgi:hypothetical protein